MDTIDSSSLTWTLSNVHTRVFVLADACSYLIDELKAKVPIWKREVYEDGSTWKANAEAFKKS